MFLRIWIVLFGVFITYTLCLYYNCDTKPQSIPSNEIAAGQAAWRNNNCQSCHQLYGLGGYLGPDLTNVTGNKGRDYTATFIKYGTGRMPNLHLSDKEVHELVAFLEWVDKTGTSKVPANAVHWTGTYIMK